MGTTLANMHILGAGLEQIQTLMPQAVVGIWSRNCVSVFAAELVPTQVDKQARQLSRKLAQPVLSVWIFDSDAVGFSIFQDGAQIAAHIHNPDGYHALGNIPLFCRAWGLPEDDVPRLRAVWKKGDAEAQLELTACLLGLPLSYDCAILPEQPCRRETEPVDRWIMERPTLPRIKNQAKAELVQELPMFRYHKIHASSVPCYVSVEPYDDQYVYGRYHLWGISGNGAMKEIWSTDRDIRLFVSMNRTIAVDSCSKEILYDSTGALCGRCLPGYGEPLENGTILWQTPLENGKERLACLSSDGNVLWQQIVDPSCFRLLAENGQEVLIQEHTKDHIDLVANDLATGLELVRSSDLVGTSIQQAVWNNGAWWITHNGFIPWTGNKNAPSYQLLKLDRKLNKVSEVVLPDSSQDIFFSPDGKYVYVFFFEKQVQVLDAKGLTDCGKLLDKTFLMPLAFDRRDSELYFWLLRGNGTVEAWDDRLAKPVSRHRLKGWYVGCHRDEKGRICVSTWDEKKAIFRVYRLFWI